MSFKLLDGQMRQRTTTSPTTLRSRIANMRFMIANELSRQFLAEFLGTFILIVSVCHQIVS
jgi:glycerol uptake facilitator-like aquaporin